MAKGKPKPKMKAAAMPGKKGMTGGAKDAMQKAAKANPFAKKGKY